MKRDVSKKKARKERRKKRREARRRGGGGLIKDRKEGKLKNEYFGEN